MVEGKGQRQDAKKRPTWKPCSNPVDSTCSSPFVVSVVDTSIPAYIPSDEALFVPAAGTTFHRHQLSAPSGTISASERCLDPGHVFLVIIQRPTASANLMCHVKTWPSMPSAWLCGSAILASELPWVTCRNLWASFTVPFLSCSVRHPLFYRLDPNSIPLKAKSCTRDFKSESAFWGA